jgi:integrase/recombinase XerC
VYRIVPLLGDRAGLQARPHGHRHAAITEALGLTGGDVRAVQPFSRHRNAQTLLQYDDSRKDLAGGVARRVAAAVGGALPPERRRV